MTIRALEKVSVGQVRNNNLNSRSGSHLLNSTIRTASAPSSSNAERWISITVTTQEAREG